MKMKQILLLSLLVVSLGAFGQEIVKEKFNPIKVEIVGAWLEPEYFATESGPRRLVIYRQDWMDVDVFRLAYCSEEEYLWYPLIKQKLHYSDNYVYVNRINDATYSVESDGRLSLFDKTLEEFVFYSKTTLND